MRPRTALAILFILTLFHLWPLAAVPWGVALVAWTTISVLCITALWRTSLPKTFRRPRRCVSPETE